MDYSSVKLILNLNFYHICVFDGIAPELLAQVLTVSICKWHKFSFHLSAILHLGFIFPMILLLVWSKRSIVGKYLSLCIQTLKDSDKLLVSGV